MSILHNRTKYFNQTINKSFLISKYNYNNIHKVPELNNITIVFLLNNAKKHTYFQKTTMCSFLYLISGQYPVYIRSKKKDILGCKVTLHKNLMFFFLDRFNTIVVPYVRNFKTIFSNFINNKVYCVGFKGINIFFETENIYKALPKYFTTFNQQVNCMVYFNFTNKTPRVLQNNTLVLNQICILK